MELHRGVRTLESEISKLKEENANKVKGEGVLAAVNVPASDANAQIDGLFMVDWSLQL